MRSDASPQTRKNRGRIHWNTLRICLGRARRRRSQIVRRRRQVHIGQAPRWPGSPLLLHVALDAVHGRERPLHTQRTGPIPDWTRCRCPSSARSGTHAPCIRQGAHPHAAPVHPPASSASALPNANACASAAGSVVPLSNHKPAPQRRRAHRNPVPLGQLLRRPYRPEVPPLRRPPHSRGLDLPPEPPM